MMFQISPYIPVRRWWLFVVLLLLLASCSSTKATVPITSSTSDIPEVRETTSTPDPTQTITPTSAKEAISMKLQWLEKQPCQAPCWELLTPGISTIAEADARLSQLDYIENLKKAPEYNQNPGFIAWQLKGDAQSGGSIEYYTKKPPFADPPLDVVLRITLVLDRPLTLQEAITSYGEPSHIQLAAEHSVHFGIIYYFSVVYLEQGFSLQPYASDSRGKPTLSPDTQLGVVILYPPGLQGFDAANEAFFPIRQPSQFLVKWEGFSKDMNVYCREMRVDAPEKGCE